MNRRKISDRDKIENAVSGPMRELRNSNIRIQQFVQLCKKYSKGSQDTTVVTRQDLWNLYNCINQNSAYKIDIKQREFHKCNANDKNIFITYLAFKDKNIMLDIANKKFKCVPFVKKFHNINNFCKEWIDLVEKVHQKNINLLFPDLKLSDFEQIEWEDEEEQNLFELFDDYGNSP